MCISHIGVKRICGIIKRNRFGLISRTGGKDDFSMNLDRIIAVRNNKTVFRDGDRVIKVFDNDFTKAEILNEALNQSLVEETGLHIPSVLEVSTIDGRWAIVSEYIKGKNLTQLILEDSEKWLEIMVTLHRSVALKAVPALPKLNDKLHRKICASVLPATVRYDIHNRLDAMPKHASLCHGDFNPSNITVTPDGTPYILDWSHASHGDPASDAAMTHLMFLCDGQKELADRYLELYCEKSGTEAEHIKRWIPIMAAAASASGIPEKREFYISIATALESDVE